MEKRKMSKFNTWTTSLGCAVLQHFERNAEGEIVEHIVLVTVTDIPPLRRESQKNWPGK